LQFRHRTQTIVVPAKRITAMPDVTTSDDVSNKEKFRAALLALMEVRIKAEKEFHARPEGEKENPHASSSARR
jgi:hypothetical protein